MSGDADTFRDDGAFLDGDAFLDVNAFLGDVAFLGDPAFPDIHRLFVQFGTISGQRILTDLAFISTVRCMTDDRMSGLALIAGSFGFIITMSLHPSGRDLFVPGQLEPMAHMAVATHVLALASLPVLFLGAFGLTQRLATADRLAIEALVLRILNKSTYC